MQRMTALIAVAWLVAACSPGSAETQARAAALQYYTSVREPGTKVENVHIVEARQGTRDCPDGWAVNIWGEVTEPGSPVSWSNPMWLCVDSTTGKVTITAQG